MAKTLKMAKTGDNRESIKIIPLVAVVLVLVILGFMIGRVSGQQTRVIGSGDGGGTVVRANSCDADSVCEMNSGNVSNGLFVTGRLKSVNGHTFLGIFPSGSGSFPPVLSIDRTFIGSISPSQTWRILTLDANSTKIKGSLFTDSIIIGQGNMIFGGFFPEARFKVNYFNVSVFGQSRPIIFASRNNITFRTSFVVFSTLSGTGNGYACINSAGILYRSSFPCV